jgi:gluconate 2-dehydrogenase gamma chain
MKHDKQEVLSKQYIDLTEEDWHMSRKSFVRAFVLSGIAIQLPWLQSCAPSNDDFGDIHPLTLSQFKTVREIQNILFPADGNGPGALEVNSDKYLLWILRDSLLDPNENTYIIKRIDQFTKECKEKYITDFFDLNDLQKVEFISTVSKKDWGKQFLSRLLTLIFEALLLDPVYGGNVNEAGWKWLEHDPGRPRPTKEIIYPAIFKKHEI